ncbi:LPS-assembly protein [Faunimonas pinastri]|uniref:LPS-assembly protein LptD n=1 Tax=Faunimonas pinastri TaxID=1855383 RepID=A0A1H9D029_9HYPH|nr:LPS-assembly protein LptD [Faunimonas pinastri]SEQ06805.1 LPS-assembly protein [Faunimonas pinastri]
MTGSALPVNRIPRMTSRVFRTLLLACSALVLATAPLQAQSLGPSLGAPNVKPGEKMLLEADQLVYDFDRKLVSAVGSVEIYYGPYVVDAGKVTYDQNSGVLMASDGVRITDATGNVTTAQTADLTDNFANGFIQSINVETTDQAHFSAASGERRDGNLMIFRKGVYTACDECRKNPARPPLWQIKATRIVQDNNSHTIYYRNARLEFWGIPVAYFPYFFSPDNTVKKKTGFLAPTVHNSSSLGYGVTTPFFWNLAPNYDVTFSPSVYSKQGVMGQFEFRQKVLGGSYMIRPSGIMQQDKEEFAGYSGDRDFRGGVQTKGDFNITPRWAFGWDLAATTDRTFTRDYHIEGADTTDLTEQIYLTGRSNRNNFAARAYYFKVQRENTVDTVNGVSYEHDDQAEQAIVHPVIDHNYILSHPILGGEVSFDSNVTSVTRDKSDIHHTTDGNFVSGAAGNFNRAGTDITWKRTVMGPAGQVFTPFAYLKTDVNWEDSSDDTTGVGNGLYPRAMPAIGLDYQYPFLATTSWLTQTITPRAQIIARPNEQHVGKIANEDAQSLVYDDTTLFEWDKFSGYDRQEGGTRANLGLSYDGVLSNGYSLNALFGQSFQLAGANSFALDDQNLTGIDSGLDTDQSDYVGRVTLDSGRGVFLTTRGRFDHEDMEMNRGEVSATAAYGRSNATMSYIYMREQPGLGILEDRQEVAGSASLALTRNWSVLGGLTYDLKNDERVKQSFGVAFNNDCLDLKATYSQTLKDYTDLEADSTFYLQLSLRTLGQVSSSQ